METHWKSRTLLNREALAWAAEVSSNQHPERVQEYFLHQTRHVCVRLSAQLCRGKEIGHSARRSQHTIAAADIILHPCRWAEGKQWELCGR